MNKKLKKVVSNSMRLEGYKVNISSKKIKELKTKYNVKVHI